MDELTFDTMEVNTKLAEDYLAKHKSEFEKIKSCGKIVQDGIYLDDVDDDTRLEAFAKEVQENAELIAQLEVLKRGRLREDVLNYDVKLIMDNIKYWIQNEPDHKVICLIYSVGNAPLALWGHVAKCIKLNRKYFTCFHDETTLPMTYLFAKLLRKVGINLQTSFHDENNKDTHEQAFWDLLKEYNGCTAVIGEHADVDSAVDAILASTTQDPWRVFRIYVQESVYDNMKSALSWKCKQKNNPEESGEGYRHDELRYIIYGTKHFIFDFAGRATQSQKRPVIFVEAYRTVKELLSLLKKDNSFCLSLWSSDVSESNEIAFNVNCSVVWVNDYGTLDPQISQAFYTTFASIPSLYYSFDIKVKNLHDEWFAMSTLERVEKIKESLQVLEFDNDVQNARDLVKKIFKRLKHMPSDKSFEHTSGKMLINIKIPNRYTLIDHEYYSDKETEEVLISAARGALLINIDNYGSQNPLLDALHKKSLPFCTHVKHHIVINDIDIHCNNSIYRQRVIVVRYGSIFAN